MSERPKPKPSARQTFWNFQCGAAAGCVVTCVLNPWDRALYLAIINKRSFLRAENFKHPYQGVFQTLIQRTLGTGLYFPLEDAMRAVFSDQNTLAGMAAGTLNGALMSPLALLKYQLWGHPDQNRSLWRQACSNYNSHGGLRTFFRGAPATCIRDMVFGATFSTLRRRDPQSASGSVFMTNTLAAALATVISGPFNFFRNVQFAVTPSQQPATMGQVWARFLRENKERESVWARFQHLQERFRVGWGTARVAVGFALTSQAYDMCAATHRLD